MLPDPFARLRAVPWSAARPVASEVRSALGRILSDAAADKELDALLRSRRSLEPASRAAVAETLFGVALWRRRLEWHAGSTRPELLWFAFLVSLAGLDQKEASQLVGLPFSPELRSGEPEAPGEKWSAPDWLVSILGDDADAFLRAISVPGPVFLRTNTLKATREALQSSLASEGIASEPTRYAPHGLRVLSERPNLYGTSAKRDFLFEAQDEGSQLLGALVEAQPGDRVLDFCAGAGGKTLQLACDVGASGSVSAWDIDALKLERLRVRAEKAEARNVRVMYAPPSGLFDRVLVDAPCSELGPLRRGPDIRWRIDPATFDALPAQQLQILEEAASLVRPGGRLVYATCTLRREENEAVALQFESAHADFHRVLPEFARPFEAAGFLRALPQLHDTDGFFAAVYDRR